MQKQELVGVAGMVAMTMMLKRALAVFAGVALVACGGGGGSAGTQVLGGGSGGTPTTSGATLAATISSTDVTPTTPATLTVTVKDASGAALPGQVVSLATTVGKVDVASVLTDASGSATALVQVGPTGASGADDVTATTVVGSETLSAKVGYRVTASATAPSAIEVVASANNAGTDGGQVTITAVVKGAGNVTIPGTSVQFSTDTGTLADAATLTDANGAATAKFSAGADKANRPAVISVLAGTVSGSIAIPVSGTTLSYLGATTLTLGGPAVEVTITARDSRGAAISGASLSVASTLGNVLAGSSITTNPSGVATIAYSPTNAGTDTLTVRGLGVTLNQVVTVIGQNFAFTSPALADSKQINIGATKTVTVSYRVAGAAPADGTFNVRFTTTAGTLSPASATTGIPLVSGDASATVSSTFAGPATLQATLYSAPPAPAVPVVVAQATIQVQFVAVTPKSLTLQASPSSIGPNTIGTNTQQTDVQASVIDAFSNPVANVTVNFKRLADPSGGNLSQASAVTDTNGLATVKYISGAQSTPTNGVELEASVATDPAVKNTTTLTVNQGALFIALGTGNEISNGDPANTTYLKVWTAYVTDATGAAVPNVTLTVSALPKRYRKGSYVFVIGPPAGWIYQDGESFVVAPTPSSVLDLPRGRYISCASEDSRLGPKDVRTNNGVLDIGEDTNRNGVLDPGEDTNSNMILDIEDFNGNGKLEPGNVISVNSGPSITTVKTDATGFVTINLRYAESYASWVEIGLKATAIVGGTESANEAVFWVPGMASDFSSADNPPAGVFSPFGIKADCKNPN